MTFEELSNYINMGNEIEFTYDGRNYSITYYYPDENDNNVLISFCEFYKETSEVKTPEELWNNISRYDHTVGEMLSSISDDEIRIF